MQPSEFNALPYYEVEYFLDFWQEEQEEQEKQRKKEEGGSASISNYTKDFNKQMSNMQNNFKGGNFGSGFQMPKL